MDRWIDTVDMIGSLKRYAPKTDRQERHGARSWFFGVTEAPPLCWKKYPALMNGTKHEHQQFHFQSMPPSHPRPPSNKNWHIIYNSWWTLNLHHVRNPGIHPALKPIAAVEAASMAWSKFCCALRASATAKVLGMLFLVRLYLYTSNSPLVPKGWQVKIIARWFSEVFHQNISKIWTSLLHLHRRQGARPLRLPDHGHLSSRPLGQNQHWIHEPWKILREIPWKMYCRCFGITGSKWPKAGRFWGCCFNEKIAKSRFKVVIWSLVICDFRLFALRFTTFSLLGGD